MYTVFLKDITQKVISYEVDPSDCMNVVRERYAADTGIPVGHIRLIFAGKQLEDGRTFADYCIQKESTLLVIARQVGGGEAKPAVGLPPSPPTATLATLPGQPSGLPSTWPLLDKDLSEFKEEFVDPSYRSHHEECVAEDVYSFPLLSADYCHRLVREIAHYRKQTGDSGVALRLSRVNLEASLETLLSRHLSPLVKRLYPSLPQEYRLHAKVMTYEPSGNQDWPQHVDGDLATVCVCLSSSFEGSELCLRERDGTHTDYRHSLGRAIVMLGDKQHSVKPITAGQRYSLVLKLQPIS